ncbi:MAG: hypothetical protein WBE72_19380 [Terracidiphilus sp.]
MNPIETRFHISAKNAPLRPSVRAGSRVCAALVVLALSGCAHQEVRFNQIQLAIQTGSAPLSRASTASATLRSRHGEVLEQIPLKAANQDPWNPGSIRTPTVKLTHPLGGCEARSLEVTLDAPGAPPSNDSWNVNLLSATLSIDNVDQTEVVSKTGAPLASLTASQPSFHVDVPCTRHPSLYDRLGRGAGIAAVTGDFVDRLKSDSSISAKFAPVANDPARLREFKRRMNDLMCNLSGGPCPELEPDKSPLTGVGSTAADYAAVIGDLIGAMAKFPATATVDDKNQLLGAPLIGATAAVQAGIRPRTSPTIGVVTTPIAAPIYVNLYWDTNWDADNANVATGGSGISKEAFDSLMGAVTGSTYFAGLSEYGVGAASFGGEFLPNPACTAKPPSTVGYYDPFNASIMGFLQCELDNDTSVPQGNNVVYNIILPQGSTESDSFGNLLGFTSPECTGGPTAWHFHGSPYSAGSAIGGILGGILGATIGTYFGSTGVGAVVGAAVGYLLAASQQGAPFYTISSVSTAPLNCGDYTHNVLHEMVETASDPSPPFSVMTTGNGEIVDICDDMNAPTSPSWVPTASLQSGRTLTPGGFLTVKVPQFWSNAGQACVKGFSSTAMPAITGATMSGSFPTSSIAVTGSGFGTVPSAFVIPTGANLPYAGVQDQNTAQNWQAGNSLNSDTVGMTVTSWSDSAIAISGFSPPSGSTTALNSGDPLTLWVCNPSSGLCGSSNFNSTSSGSGQNPNDIVTLGVTIRTGDDDARSDTELWLSIPGLGTPFCLKPSNNAHPSTVCPQNGGSARDQNGRQGWNNGSTDPSPQIFNLQMPAPVLPGMDIQLISHNNNGENDDNWDIQAITVTGTTRGGSTSTLLTITGPSSVNSSNCIARLKAAPNASTVNFSLDGTNTHTYVDGTSSERGEITSCTNNGG